MRPKLQETHRWPLKQSAEVHHLQQLLRRQLRQRFKILFELLRVPARDLVRRLYIIRDHRGVCVEDAVDGRFQKPVLRRGDVPHLGELSQYNDAING